MTCDTNNLAYFDAKNNAIRLRISINILIYAFPTLKSCTFTIK